MTDLKSPFYICLMKTADCIAVIADDEGVIAAQQHSHEWVREFEDAYNQAHSRSYQGSMSACIHFIQMQPSIIQVDNVEDIKQRVLDVDTLKLCSFRGEAGGFCGFVSDKPLTQLWEQGIKPRLLTQ